MEKSPSGAQILKSRAPQLARLEAMIEPTLAAMGYALVRVLVSGKQHPTLQIMAERKDEAGMTVEDCAQISRQVSALLDVEDPIEGAYMLEVSSPGIDRPLVRLEDFQRFAGQEAKIETQNSLDGRRRFTGRLLGLEGETVAIRTQEGDFKIPFGTIERAKLLLTDELLAQARKAQQNH